MAESELTPGREVAVDSRRARELVAAERARTEAALRKLSGEVRAESLLERQQTGKSDSGSELATEMVEVALVADVRTELEAVARAEERIASGSFGRSVDSGRAIPDERLEVEPLAERTLNEQRRHDVGARSGMRISTCRLDSATSRRRPSKWAELE
jgi:DnaK suppressor protein